MLKNTIAMAMAAIIMASSMVTVAAAEESVSNTICAPADTSRAKTLESHETKTYTEGDLTIVEETYVYDTTPLSARGVRGSGTKFVEITKSVTKNTLGQILTYTLDADFEYDSAALTVECPRYYSSYDIDQPEYLLPPDPNSDAQWETSFRFTQHRVGQPTQYGQVTTKYRFGIYPGGASSVDYRTPTSYVNCTVNGQTNCG